MKRIAYIVLLLFVATLADAQELTVKSFEALSTDITARTSPRNDLNGNLCALVKVEIASPGVEFEGGVVGEVENKVNEYYVYLPGGTKRLKVKHPSFLQLEVRFKDYDIPKLEPGATYQLTITIPNGIGAIITDYSQLRIGDLYYSDGSFSHEQIADMEPVGVVFSFQTTRTERQHGWTHGQIVALHDCGIEGMKYKWCTSLTDLPSPHKNYTWKKGAGRNDLVSDRSGYIYTYAGAAKGYKCPAFQAAREYAEALPEGKTSGWYLPSTGQWCDILQNLGRVTVDSKLLFNRKAAFENLSSINIRNGWYWTSTECDDKCPWIVRLNQGMISNATQKTELFRVRPVAAF